MVVHAIWSSIEPTLTSAVIRLGTQPVLLMRVFYVVMCIAALVATLYHQNKRMRYLLHDYRIVFLGVVNVSTIIVLSVAATLSLFGTPPEAFRLIAGFVFNWSCSANAWASIATMMVRKFRCERLLCFGCFVSWLVPFVTSFLFALTGTYVVPMSCEGLDFYFDIYDVSSTHMSIIWLVACVTQIWYSNSFPNIVLLLAALDRCWCPFSSSLL